MINVLLSLGLLFTASAGAQGPWLAITGDARDPTAETVEVDPATISRQGATRTIRVRVSRAKERTSWDGVPYRSYTAEVLIDCAQLKARYQQIEFFALPVWQGESSQQTTFQPSEVRPMLFRDMAPNPTQQIIRAACLTKNVQVIKR